MIKKQLHEQSLQELRKLEYLFEENSKVLGNFKGDIKNGPKNHAARPLGNWQSDNAWDLFAPADTKWYSITKGTVLRVYDTGKSTGKVYGTQVTVKGDEGYPDIFYTHLKNVTLDRGDVVDIGTYIGEVSEWGQSKSTHVHVGLPYGKHIQDLLTSDYSQTLEKSETSDYEVTDKKDPDKLEKFIDYVGIGDLANIKSGDKEGQKSLMDKASELFPDDIIDIDGEFRLFGYSLDEVLDKIEDLLQKLETVQKKKNLIENVKKIKSKIIK